MVKALIVDDDPMTCSLLETILQMENYQTASATGFGDIISLLDKEQPHILILDFHLGSSETLGQIPLIRAHRGWQHLSIVMTSAIDRCQDCLEAGADAFILKPFNWQDMLKTVNKLREKPKNLRRCKHSTNH
ncbi:MAG: response regulator [Anaerolineales bacterium]|nr:response regulator [Anaerolineales bacterium]